jgi:N-methylhydantoinase A/oxoprolinase/acetone carboxylase beta subunit
MGGTSTDVSRFDGHFEHVFETTTAGVTIQAPQLDINTVAAGGGSMLFFKNGMFVVGPEVRKKIACGKGIKLGFFTECRCSPWTCLL